MAYGEHWEWRAFGQVPPAVRRRILALPHALPGPWLVADRYLYAAGCPANVKLRGGELKLKRLLGRDGELGRWLEDPAQAYPFPLAAAVVAEMAAALGVTLPALPEQALNQGQLLALLRHAEPPVHEVVVVKARHLRWLALPGVEPHLLVELAEIAAPQVVQCVALEHGQAEPLRRARAWLGLDAALLSPMGYLDALAHWAQGHTLPTSESP